MNPSDWLDIAADIRDRWPHSQLPEESLIKWGSDLADLPADQVRAVVDALSRDGREHAPSSGVIRAKLAELSLDEPTWSDVFDALRRLVHTPEKAIGASHEVIEDDDVVAIAVDRWDHPRDEALAAAHPMIRAFVESIGWEQIAEGADRDASGNNQARLREKWFAFARSLNQDVRYRGIPDAGLPALVRANGPRQIGDSIAKVRGELEAA